VTLPPGQEAPLADVTDAIAANNDLTLSRSEVETIARECMGRMVEAGEDAQDCGRLPIFVTGYDANEAAIHDREAISTGVPGSMRIPNPRWIRLNYMKGSLQPSPGRSWLVGAPECVTTLEPRPHCDEFPFFATEQGGPSGGNVASLKLVKAEHNVRQGDLYGFLASSFVKTCSMGSVGDADPNGTTLAQGDPFIALPVPDIPAIATIPNICNGKTTVGG
jgi:hypothetical protein